MINLCTLDSLTVDTVTEATLTTELTAIVDIIVSATAELKALVGLDIEIDITVVVKLIAQILIVCAHHRVDYSEADSFFERLLLEPLLSYFRFLLTSKFYLMSS